MNPWELLLTLFGWVMFILAALGAVILVFAFIVGIVRAARGLAKQTKPQVTLEEYLREARTVATSVHGNDFPLASTNIDIWLEGARWAWGFFHRKK
ncbi:membrane protein [Microbacterium phage Schubert]|uniref:Membrane protein n=1 Tax=Microbacterium phage Schubert TaxID=2500787 RepID=A0A3T0INX1_9CAUD|nr:membrane protein [Microbacterium phage Schubert]AZV01753.1 membrane protein [Microbacterium phage Schubert]